MKNEIKVICATCGAIVKDGPEIDGSVSHGICSDCFFRVKQILKFRYLNPEFDDLTDQQIWAAFKDSRQMAIATFGVRVDEFTAAIKGVGVSAREFIDGIYIGFKKLKGKF